MILLLYKNRITHIEVNAIMCTSCHHNLPFVKTLPSSSRHPRLCKFLAGEVVNTESGKETVSERECGGMVKLVAQFIRPMLVACFFLSAFL